MLTTPLLSLYLRTLNIIPSSTKELKGARKRKEMKKGRRAEKELNTNSAFILASIGFLSGSDWKESACNLI